MLQATKSFNTPYFDVGGLSYQDTVCYVRGQVAWTPHKKSVDIPQSKLRSPLPMTDFPLDASHNSRLTGDC